MPDMTLAVLGENHVKEVLENLTADELEGFKLTLSEALHEYSTNTQAVEDGTYLQPARVSTHSPATGCTTLYMPSCSPAGMGCKVVTLSNADRLRDADDEDDSRPLVRPTGAITLLLPSGAPVGFVHAETLTAFRTALASSCLLAKRAQVRVLTVFGAGSQAYWHVRLALMMRGASIKTVNIINRRFSDNARRLLKRFYVVPSAAKAREGWEATTFGILTPSYGEFQRLQREQIRSADVIYCCTPSTAELFDASILTNHEGRRKGRLIVAVGSYTSKMIELPVELLLQATKQYDNRHRHFHKHAPEGGVIVVDTLDGALKEAGEIIAAGIKPTQLIELGELIMLKRMALEDSEVESVSGSSIASSEFETLKLDFLPGTSAMSSVFGGSSSGSGSGSGSGASGGEQRASDAASTTTAVSEQSRGRKLSSTTTTTTPTSPGSSPRIPFAKQRSSSHGSADRQRRKEDSLSRWLSNGTVIYKSVGLGLMDLAVGMHLIKVAAEKGIGNHIGGFGGP